MVTKLKKRWGTHCIEKRTRHSSKGEIETKNRQPDTTRIPSKRNINRMNSIRPKELRHLRTESGLFPFKIGNKEVYKREENRTSERKKEDPKVKCTICKTMTKMSENSETQKQQQQTKVRNKRNNTNL